MNNLLSDTTANGDSQVFKVSIRAWLALLLTGTVCAMSGLGVEVNEPLYSMALLALGFYFGQKVPPKTV